MPYPKSLLPNLSIKFPRQVFVSILHDPTELVIECLDRSTILTDEKSLSAERLAKRDKNEVKKTEYSSYL